MGRAKIAAVVALALGASCTGGPASAPRPRQAEPAPAPAEPSRATGPSPRIIPDPWTLEASLSLAPHEVPAGAPTAVVHAPGGLDLAQPLDLVVFLHGWSGCARVLASAGAVPCRDGERARAGWGLAAEHARSGARSLFVVSQLAFMVRHGRAGRFAEPGFALRYFEALVREAVERHFPGSSPRLGALTLVAHSAGYESAAAILVHGEIATRVRHVVLFDALYAQGDVFADWLASAPDGSRLVSLYTGRASTFRESQRMARALASRLGEGAVAVDPEGSLEDAIRAHRVVVARAASGHGAVPKTHLAEVLRALSPAEAD